MKSIIQFCLFILSSPHFWIGFFTGGLIFLLLACYAQRRQTEKDMDVAGKEFSEKYAYLDKWL